MWHVHRKDRASPTGVNTNIVFCGPVTEKTAYRLIRLIREAEEEAQTALEEAEDSLPPSLKKSKLVKVDVLAKPITLTLTTPGGSVHAAWAVVDTILRSTMDIHTVISGFVASAGTLISVAGKKRFMGKHAHALIHEVCSGARGKYSDLRDQLANTDKLTDSLVRFYVERTKMEEEKLRTLLSRDRCWDCDESLQHGLIDEVLT